MLPVQKPTILVEVLAELLQRIDKLVALMIVTQTNEIPPTLGEWCAWQELLWSLGDSTKGCAGLLLDRPALVLPAPSPGQVKLPQGDTSEIQ